MDFLKSLLSKITNKYQVITFVVLDIVIVAIISFIAFLLRFDGLIPVVQYDRFIIFTALALLITPIVFAIFGMYKISWSYVSVTDIPTILKSVAVTILVLAGIMYLSRTYPAMIIPRSIIFLYGIMLFIFAGTLRFSKRIYWQLIHSNKDTTQIDEDPGLPLTQEAVDSATKNILITGGAGYIGCLLSRVLLDNGYQVKVVDNLLFGDDSIKDLYANPNFQLIKGDMTDAKLMTEALFDVDAVVNLGGLVGEPACLANKDLALKLNYLATVYLARLCKSFGIRRFIQASTCSTYGQQKNDQPVKETGHLFPVDFYGETKIYAERELSKLADNTFCPTFLRFCTVYGLSPRMRFDLVVNILTKKAVQEKKITIFGGDQWRPLIHVADVADVIYSCLKLPLYKVGNQVFNVGNNSENYRISDVGELVKKHFPEIELENIEGMQDKRSYMVDFSKIEKNLNFKVKRTVPDGIKEIEQALLENRFGDTESKKYYNHKA